MSRKKSRRRPADGPAEQPQAEALQHVAPSALADDEATRAARRAEQKREWAQRKRKKEGAARSTAPYIWGGGLAAVIALAVVGGVLLFSGGGDNRESDPSPTVREDPRVAGLPIDVTLTVNMDDSGQNVNPRFEPSTITAEAGQVVEIIAPNIGSVAHNLRLAGLNGEYEAGAPRSDDWVTTPESVDPGDEGRVVVKIDEPGNYPFKCDFHPTQVGTLILN
ncbi:MAG TPA: cupredoxin domain-containing protein [Dehalococcoidia bacterium]|nr:cupredoxin domain-containing protein [Dehalococcoidia bacterium]